MTQPEQAKPQGWGNFMATEEELRRLREARDYDEAAAAACRTAGIANPDKLPLLITFVERTIEIGAAGLLAVDIACLADVLAQCRALPAEARAQGEGR